MRRGVRLALDWGKARIGVAASDRDALLAFPVETIAAGPGAITRVVALVAEYEPIELILGLPRNLAGEDGPAAVAMLAVADELAAVLPELPLRLVDERMTTAAASRQLSGVGRNTRKQRSVIDQAAAVALLETALQQERNTGRPAGEQYHHG
ncbi:Holliday junction resolvase RuvX [Propionicimonas sp.]|uniref:Holliday junction resolvase RuvX n=1 Tax=Propionicimonas sp. TaxID=1955623 RepID=UPI00182B228E|nr:Holliday junction resolvase RuvX [Propionicimonas sp.]MBU3977379.1 Holliday junction resolvase RuvX [Actinomycetota bacterium]MBA3021303.1 Holliday junction resolvase RuvX [Propionicimonas sp.]MBU3985889.1 Holliday junction resolvase RuvX [Actinomycetota bacterium]MBU4008674.1 Holliday junction resolvase RuvX [Actinomycetota bacterium]MBU4066176.1 Holliday junction resolvase RuvX [Actinomycetota bacterium]